MWAILNWFDFLLNWWCSSVLYIIWLDSFELLHIKLLSVHNELPEPYSYFMIWQWEASNSNPLSSLSGSCATWVCLSFFSDCLCERRTFNTFSSNRKIRLHSCIFFNICFWNWWQGNSTFLALSSLLFPYSCQLVTRMLWILHVKDASAFPRYNPK